MIVRIIYFSIIILFQVALMGWQGIYDNLLFNIGALLLVCYLSLKLNIIPKSWHFTLSSFKYLCFLIKEIALSAWLVTKFAWDPERTYKPSLSWINTSQDTDLGKMLYACSITLTPGTVSVAIDEGQILVHAIDESIIEDLNQQIMDKKLKQALC